MTRLVLAALFLLALAAPAAATPVCTDGYKGGPPAAACGGRIFPEAAVARAYVQYTADPFGFIEYQHGIEYLAQKYPRWVSVFKLRDRYGPLAVSAGNDGKRAGEPGDTGDGRDIWVIKITDHTVADKGKDTLFHSLSVHGNERGGLEGGLRTAEDLAMAATNGGKVADGVANYDSATGRKPVFHEYEVKDVLRKQALYLMDFNLDGWAVGDLFKVPTAPYARGNSIGTDINRQMPSKGSINLTRNPLEENEARYGHKFMHDVAAAGRNGKMAYGSDIHGELTSQAYVDVMYPAGQFDSVDHRRLMAIAERTKSTIDATLYGGIIDQIENASSGNEGEAEDKNVPTKPAHWATVWDTLGYTDTGFIGDYLATELGVTGMDYEIAFNHTVPDKAWNVYLQENHINATRQIIKTSMAYTLFQEEEFNARNVRVDPDGRAGFVVDPDTVTDKDENGVGVAPGPGRNFKSANGKPIQQVSYDVTNQRWFADTSRLMPRPFFGVRSADVAEDDGVLDQVDTLVLADNKLPADPRGRPVSAAGYFRNVKAWVERGGNLVLTDRALHALGDLGIVPKNAVKDVKVYQPYANIRDFTHGMVKGLRPNARQLVEAPILGYGIGNGASPMTIVAKADWEKAGGRTVATTGDAAGNADDQTQTSIGELKLGKGLVRIVGGALPTPTESLDHRYGLRDYGLTYTGLFTMENSIKHDAPGLGTLRPSAAASGAAAEGGAGAPAVRTALQRAAARCTSKRRLSIRVRDPRGRERITSLRVTVAGKRQATLRGRSLRRARRGSRFNVPVRFSGRAAGTVIVRIVGRTSRGRTVRVTRRYRLCAIKAKPKAKTKKSRRTTKKKVA